MIHFDGRLFFSLLFVFMLPFLPSATLGHGSVSPDDDFCIIQIGFYRAHFKIYQPESSGRREFCEDLPRTGEAIFIMEYMHQQLGNVLLDFRIIRNVTGQGRFANLDDVEQIADLEAVTVFYREPATEPGVYTVQYDFEERGDYLGIVTIRNSEQEVLYAAVFPFRVGFPGLGLLPLFLLLALAAHLAYKYGNRYIQSQNQDINPTATNTVKSAQTPLKRMKDGEAQHV